MAFIAAASLFAAAVACLWLLASMTASSSPDPDPGAAEQTAEDHEGQRFPKVDWDKWERINPDVVGWVSIPGTDVSHPILQASASDPDFYLSHDAYRNWSVYGAPYLDASSEDDMDSRNLVVFGHHMRDGSMFAPVASYAGRSWARGHRKVLVQTREWKRVFIIDGAVVPGREPSKRCSFEDD